MTFKEFSEFAGGIQSLASVIAIFIGGVWVYFKFIRQQENFSHVQSAAEIVPISKQGDSWIVELIAVLENKGKVTHQFEQFEFDLNGLSKEDAVRSAEQWGGQVDFCRNIAKGSFFPQRMQKFFIGPGVTARYSWIARVPVEMSVINLHCTFAYADRPSSRHTMEATVVLEQSERPT